VVSPELAQQLSDLGGFALFLLVVTIAGVGFYRGWFVPGWIYRQEREARQKAELSATRNAELLEQLARDMNRESRRGSRDADA
jgi:hypothetical protein